MDARLLLKELDALGVTLTEKAGRPSLRFPPGTEDWKKAELLTGVSEHRDIVLRHFQGSTAEPEDFGEQCKECRGWVFGGADDGAVSQACGVAMCPYWRPGVGPDWLADYRNREAYKRRGGGDHKRR